MLDITQMFDGVPAYGLTAPTGTAITASRASLNVLDMLAARDMGAGFVLGVNIAVTQAFATLTSLDIEYQVSDAAAGTYYTLLEEKAIPVAQLIVGAPLFRYALPMNQIFNATAGVLAAPGRYHRLNYTVNGSNATAGAVVAWLAPILDRTQTYIYPRNYTV